MSILARLKQAVTRRQIRPAYLYLIGSENGPNKVGYASNLEKRFSQLQSATHDRLHVKVKERIDGDVVRAMERACHHLLKKYKIRGEWYNVTEDQFRYTFKKATEMVSNGWNGSSPYLKGFGKREIILEIDGRVLNAAEAFARLDCRDFSNLVEYALFCVFDKHGYPRPDLQQGRKCKELSTGTDTGIDVTTKNIME